MHTKSGAVAFLLWGLGLIGICGLHRFYLGRPVTGLIWLFTLGLLGIGQFIDLFLLGSMVREANMFGMIVNKNTNTNSVVVNIDSNLLRPSPEQAS